MAIIELSKSIEAVGLIYPVVLRRVGEGLERIIDYRRIEAYKILGKETIPAIILDLGFVNHPAAREPLQGLRPAGARRRRGATDLKKI